MIQSSGPIPNPAEYLLVSDPDFAGFTELVEAEDVHMAMSHMLLGIMWPAARVLVLGEHPTVYAPDASWWPRQGCAG